MAQVFNKKDLADRLADEFDMTKKAATAQLTFIFDEIVSQLGQGSTVELSGFGKLIVKHKKAHEGINPATLEKVQVAPKNSVSFKPSKAMKEKIN